MRSASEALTFDYAEENGDPGAIRGRAQLAKRIRERATPSFAG